MSFEENKKQGWVKLYRSILTNTALMDMPSAYFKIFVVILLMANHEENDWVYKGRTYHCKPGQLWTSASSLARKCGRGVSGVQVKRALVSMCRSNILSKQVSHYGTLITVENWGFYQGMLEEGVPRSVPRSVQGSVPPKKKKVSTNKNDIYIQEKEKEYKEKESFSVQEVEDEEGDPNWFANLVDETDWSKFEKTRGEDNV